MSVVYASLDSYPTGHGKVFLRNSLDGEAEAPAEQPGA